MIFGKWALTNHLFSVQVYRKFTFERLHLFTLSLFDEQLLKKKQPTFTEIKKYYETNQF